MFLKLKNSWRDKSRKKSEKINNQYQDWKSDYHYKSTNIKKDVKKIGNTEIPKNPERINGTHKWI